MTKNCEHYNKCDQISDHRQGLEQEDGEKQTYFFTVCTQEGSDVCMAKQKSLEKELEEK